MNEGDLVLTTRPLAPGNYVGKIIDVLAGDLFVVSFPLRVRPKSWPKWVKFAAATFKRSELCRIQYSH